MFVPNRLIGLKPHEAEAMRDFARTGRPACYGALINAQSVETPQPNDRAISNSSPAAADSDKGLLRSGPGVPAHMTYEGIIRAKEQM